MIGGSAGCALASRLSEDPSVKVLLIEAGGDGLHLETRIPVAAGELQHTACDWEEYCETQPNRACTKIIDGKSFWPRGKCLGGSSILNYMAYVRGNQEDYNSWANLLSDPKWGWDSVRNIFKRMENCSTIRGLNSSIRGMNGPLNVSIKYPVNPIACAFVQAASALGYRIDDYNGINQECASILQTTTKSGSRHSAADAYIWPVINGRENLHVLLNTEVTRVIFDQSSSSSSTNSSFLRTKGIEYFDSRTKQLKQIHCNREVILSASAVGSPKLLLLSGIGPSNELEALGIPCLMHHPHVGKNLQDHVVIPTVVNATKTPPVDIGTINQHKGKNFPNGLWALLEWLFFGTGHLASSTYDTALFYKSGLNKELPFPDLQLGESTDFPPPPPLPLSLPPPASLTLALNDQGSSLDYSLGNSGLIMLALTPRGLFLTSSLRTMLKDLFFFLFFFILTLVARSPCALRIHSISL
jgi:choline dehydrogenase